MAARVSWRLCFFSKFHDNHSLVVDITSQGLTLNRGHYDPPDVQNRMQSALSLRHVRGDLHVRIWIESVSFYFFPSTCRARWWKFNENILGRRGAKFIVFELSMSWTLELEDQYFNNGAGYSIWWMNSTRRSEDGKWTSSQNDWRGASERGTTDVRSWGQTYSGWLLYFDMRARGAGERVLELVDRSLVDMYLHEEKIVAIKIAMSVSSQTIQPGGIRYECLEIIKIKINAHLFTLVKVADY